MFSMLSVECAKKCGISRLVDRGCSRIIDSLVPIQRIGGIHFCPVQIGDDVLHAAFHIHEFKYDFILGIDILLKYKCIVYPDKLVIGTTGTEVSFLSKKKAVNLQRKVNKKALMCFTANSTGAR